MSNRASQGAAPSLIEVLKPMAYHWRDCEERARQSWKAWQRKTDEEKDAEYEQLEALQGRADDHVIHDLFQLIEEHAGDVLPREVMRDAAWYVNSGLGLRPLKRQRPGVKPNLPDLRWVFVKLNEFDVNGTTATILRRFERDHPGMLSGFRGHKRRGRQPPTAEQVGQRKGLTGDWKDFKAGKHGQKKDFCKDRGIKVVDLNRALSAERATRNRKGRAHE